MVHYNRAWVRRWVKAVAICLGSHVFTSEASLSEHVLAHEYCHVLQYRQYGFFGYLVRWFYWTWKVGYLKNPFEVKACAYADEVAPRAPPALNWPAHWDWDGCRRRASGGGTGVVAV